MDEEQKVFTIVTVKHYTVKADSFAEAVEKAMDDDYAECEEEFPDVDGGCF